MYKHMVICLFSCPIDVSKSVETLRTKLMDGLHAGKVSLSMTSRQPVMDPVADLATPTPSAYSNASEYTK